ncbi:MAG: DUF1570 domain-containing protein [Xanthomonadales bacterium]|nr:DUF1570 domain-containing protein [Xanthomonadales bacterium]
MIGLLLFVGLATLAWQLVAPPDRATPAPVLPAAIAAEPAATMATDGPRTESNESAPAVTPTLTADVALPPSSKGALDSSALAELNRRLQAMEGVPPPNCRPRAAPTTAPAATASIHRWRDPTSGQWQFGAYPPAGVDAEPVQINDRAQARFGLSVDAEPGLEVPSQLRDRAAADVVRLTAILGGELGLTIDPTFQLKVHFVATPEAVVAGRQTGLERAAGVYMHQDQRIIIWRQPVDQETFQTLRHETTHALLHEFVGAPPLWLNEGLAEYFEGLQTAGSGGRVDANAWYAELLSLAGEGRPGLAMDVLGADAKPFRNARTAELYYAQSWALVDHLMSSEGGQQLLASLLQALRDSACGSFSSIAWLDRHYPGGATELAKAASGQRSLAHSY